jgi:hypothetical protein
MNEIKTLKIKIQYRDLSTEELENLIFDFMGVSGGKIFSISKIEDDLK